MTEKRGFIAIPRAVLESEWYRDASPLARALWMELLSMANFTESTTRRGLALKPGQLVTSWGHLRSCLGYAGRGGRKEHPPLMNIRRTAAFLEKAGEVLLAHIDKRYGSGTLVTLVRWDLYAGESIQAAYTPAETAARSYAGIAAPLEQEDLPPAGRTEPPLERRRRTIEEIRALLAEERRRREGKSETGQLKP